MYQQCTYNQLITWTHHWQLPSAASLRPASFCLRPPLLEGESTSVSVLATDRQVFMCSGLPVFGQIVAACTFSSRPDRKFGRFDILTTCLRKHCQCCHFLETSVSWLNLLAADALVSYLFRLTEKYCQILFQSHLTCWCRLSDSLRYGKI